MTSTYLKNATTKKKTKQTQPIPGRDQVQNAAGGFVYDTGIWTQMQRFLILGSEGGTYYAHENKLTTENVGILRKCLAADPTKYLDTIVQVSVAGRAPKNDPAILALALFFGEYKGDDQTLRGIAQIALPQVCRTGTHLFQFVSFVTGMRGWGRGLRTAVGDWYSSHSTDDLAYQMMKYANREGYTHKDLLRLAHPKRASAASQNLFCHVLGKPFEVESLPPIVVATDRVKTLEIFSDAEKKTLVKASVKELVKLITDYNLPREVVPTEFFNSREVWEALLQKMPVTATIRNLGKLTQMGLLKPLSSGTKLVTDRVTNLEILKKGRVHPLNVLFASRAYSAGRSIRGFAARGSGLEWTPVKQIIEALDDAFYMAFQTIKPTGKRYYLGLDISGSMAGSMIQNTNLSAREGSMAMAMVTMRTEQQYELMGFTAGGQYGRGNHKGTNTTFGYRNNHADYGMTPIPVTSRMLLEQACVAAAALPMGGTDCAMPMLDAIERKLEVDAFITYTDNETWAGDIHPSQALEKYRQKMGIDAKMVAVGMTATGYSIADPNDLNSMNVEGFDSAAPALIADFVGGGSLTEAQLEED